MVRSTIRDQSSFVRLRTREPRMADHYPRFHEVTDLVFKWLEEKKNKHRP